MVESLMMSTDKTSPDWFDGDIIEPEDERFVDATDTALGQEQVWARLLAAMIQEQATQFVRKGLDLGRMLAEFDRGPTLPHGEQVPGWSALGYDSFNHWLAEADLPCGSSTAHNMKALYETFVLRFKYDVPHLMLIGPSKLQVIKPYATESNHAALVLQAESLPSRDELQHWMAAEGYGKGKGPVVFNMTGKPMEVARHAYSKIKGMGKQAIVRVVIFLEGQSDER